MGDTWLQSVLMVQRIEQSIKDDICHTDAHVLTPRACYVLKCLYEKDGQKASDLAKQVGILPTGFTPTLDALENAGFIKRKASPSDRRSVIIYITQKAVIHKMIIQGALANAEVRYGEG